LHIQQFKKKGRVEGGGKKLKAASFFRISKKN